jgi:hypothetical protein
LIEPNMLSGHGDYHPAAGRSLIGDNRDIAIDTPSSVLGGEAFLARVFDAYRERSSDVRDSTTRVAQRPPEAEIGSVDGSIDEL